MSGKNIQAVPKSSGDVSTSESSTLENDIQQALSVKTQRCIGELEQAYKSFVENIVIKGVTDTAENPDMNEYRLTVQNIHLVDKKIISDFLTSKSSDLQWRVTRDTLFIVRHPTVKSVSQPWNIPYQEIAIGCAVATGLSVLGFIAYKVGTANYSINNPHMSVNIDKKITDQIIHQLTRVANMTSRIDDRLAEIRNKMK